jgi:hypothetical protein
MSFLSAKLKNDSCQSENFKWFTKVKSALVSPTDALFFPFCLSAIVHFRFYCLCCMRNG